MNKIKKYLPIFIFITIIIILFKYNYILQNSVIDGVTIWLYKIFPSLFIMFVLNNIIINLDILKAISKLINPIFNKIFNTTGDSSNAFLLSILSGTPASSFIIKEMLNNNKITLNDANKLISFTYFSNPLFLYTILSLSFNKYTVIKIILTHYASNIIIGLLFRNKCQKNDLITSNNTPNHQNFFSILSSSINKSLNTLIMILGTIVFYMIITNLISAIFNLDGIYNIIIKGFFEITQSLNMLPNLNVNSFIKEIITIIIISFGGLSIHTQVISIINDTKINYKYFLIGRILHILMNAWTYFFISTVFCC